MTQPTPSLLDAIAEICKWHGLVQSRHPSRVLRDGGRQEILPPEIPQAIRNGEIPVPEELRTMLYDAAIEELATKIERATERLGMNDS